MHHLRQQHENKILVNECTHQKTTEKNSEESNSCSSKSNQSSSVSTSHTGPSKSQLHKKTQSLIPLIHRKKLIDYIRKQRKLVKLT